MNLASFFLAFGSFFLGSIPFGFLLAKYFGGLDIRKKGSGNIGATNVTRLLGWKVGLPVLLLDVSKGALPILLARYALHINSELTLLLCGIAAIAGHVFSPFLKMKGGKGVATSFGVFLVLAPGSVFFSLVVFLFLKKVFGFVSLGSIGGAISLPISYVSLSRIEGSDFPTPTFWAICCISTAILILHRTNLLRLIRGREFSSDKEKYKKQTED
ncbi:acyl-phosphate glycerol 3-phosphate acyltransferase [Leptospira inadai serovar Lyme str. 10]|uniref:Glycerol-3-phosphate acyltransferase n=2 Tax=Leptospira inadai serovar Lyme TaxID=293084 RepID=V6HI54_9LEPT|nr:glycerol-3-phosphate 1-O-acyltransferase PlsY [Leptospira inadai]EQA36285.1 acyl-phosphate glycerol 3-phosphate acyltransferase [Leptospira inadai serovar Lyme str. 10]PNV76444.1 acyl-phosphate glycerol 3-phosphate acyltransferase [Leptospira inadai serovar Lyme]